MAGSNAYARAATAIASEDRSYRVVYTLDDQRHSYIGTIRRDSGVTSDVTIGLLTCIWDFGFPHTDFTTHLAAHKPISSSGPAIRYMSRSAAMA
jgi:hypothetical protein